MDLPAAGEACDWPVRGRLVWGEFSVLRFPRPIRSLGRNNAGHGNPVTRRDPLLLPRTCLSGPQSPAACQPARPSMMGTNGSRNTWQDILDAPIFMSSMYTILGGPLREAKAQPSARIDLDLGQRLSPDPDFPVRLRRRNGVRSTKHRAGRATSRSRGVTRSLVVLRRLLPDVQTMTAQELFPCRPSLLLSVESPGSQ